MAGSLAFRLQVVRPMGGAGGERGRGRGSIWPGSPRPSLHSDSARLWDTSASICPVRRGNGGGSLAISTPPHLREHCMPLCMHCLLIYFQPDLLDQAICFLIIKTGNPRLGTRKQIQLLSLLQPCLKAWPSGKLSAACHPRNVPF